MCDTLYSIKENIFQEFFYLIKTFFYLYIMIVKETANSTQ